MEPCRQCEHCGIYKEYWCQACRYRYSCRINKNMTRQHKIEHGCKFENGTIFKLKRILDTMPDDFAEKEA